MSSVRIFTKKVTPDEAIRFLKKNSSNRKLNLKNVDFYHGQMVKGQWVLTGDAIQFNTKGELINGQHRLEALIKYGKPLDFAIAENVPDAAFKVIDTGKVRSAGDALSIMGYKNCYNIAGTVRAILLFKSGRYDINTGRQRGTSNTDIVEFADGHKNEIADIVTYTNGIYRQFRHMNPSLLAMLYYVFSKKNQEDCDVFFEKYATGIDLGEQSPIRILRERLMKDTLNRTKLKVRDKIALHVFAWNAYRQKKRITNLALLKNYTFPKPI